MREVRKQLCRLGRDKEMSRSRKERGGKKKVKRGKGVVKRIEEREERR
jgi:hypothetical protein